MSTQQRERDKALLLHRMAVQGIKRANRLSTDAENEAMMPYALGAMVYTAVANDYLYDLESNVERDLQNYRPKVHIIKRVHKLVADAHEAIYQAFEEAYKGYGQYYNAELDRVKATIESHVLIEGAERKYNIVLATLGLLRKYNDACKRWRCPAILNTYNGERWIRDLALPYADKVEITKTIIDKAVKFKWGYEDRN